MNRSALVVRPKQPFLEWLHAADPTSGDLTLEDVGSEPTIYLIPACNTDKDMAAMLHELCGEIFVEELSGWLTATETWPQDRSFDVFCRWFDVQHHSVLVDLSDQPLIGESD